MIREQTDVIRRCCDCQEVATHVVAAQSYKAMVMRVRILQALPSHGRALADRRALEAAILAARFVCAKHGELA